MRSNKAALNNLEQLSADYLQQIQSHTDYSI